MRYINNVRPNIIRGGQAIPIGHNLYYMKGKKHSQGGIDIGKDLEVEGGELMQITPKELRVFSAKKFLGGNSPAEKVLDGKNPNKVFKEQEEYKDKNHLNDDGTKKAETGIRKTISGEEMAEIRARKAIYPKYNYWAAKDGNISMVRSDLSHIAQNLGISKTGLSNCTLTATQWANPFYPLMKAKTIINNPNKHGFYKTDEVHSFPGQLVIATNPNNGANHTMMITGYQNKKGNYNFDGNDYIVEEGEPLVTYSKGKDSKNNIRRNIPLSVYIKNSDGKTDIKYYGLKGNNEVIPINLPEITVIGNKTKKTMGGIKQIIPFTGKRKEAELGTVNKLNEIVVTAKAPKRKINILGNYPLKTINNENKKRFKVKLYYNKSNNNSFNNNNNNSNNNNSNNDNIFRKTYNSIKSDVIDNPKDYIGAGANVLGSIGSFLINRSAINNMRAPSVPIGKTPAKLKTRININPQLDKMRETVANYENNIRTNTSSSATALNRINRARFAGAQQVNQLYSQKENIETQLINEDKINQQKVVHENIDKYNEYTDRVVDFNNRMTDLRSENRNALISGLVSTVQDGLERKEKRNTTNANIILTHLANPNVQEYMKTLGPDYIKKVLKKAGI